MVKVAWWALCKPSFECQSRKCVDVNQCGRSARWNHLAMVMLPVAFVVTLATALVGGVYCIARRMRSPSAELYKAVPMTENA